MEAQLPVNGFKRALREKRRQMGIWCALCNSYSTEVIAGSGFDWLLIDMEHGPNDLFMVVQQLQATMGSPTHPIVRIPWNDMVTVKRVLDAGAQTLLIPYVQTGEEAKSAVSYTRYAPEGVRGSGGPTRASKAMRIKDYIKRAHEEICVLVQVESRLGIQNLEEICAVPGIDGVFVGPGDLSTDMGHAGNPTHPEVQKVIDDAIRKIVASGKAPGILTHDERLVRHYMELGTLFIACASDIVVLARQTEAIAAKYKS
jgi:4-hydroxy-2-oxoheptanedioate aldolase